MQPKYQLTDPYAEATRYFDDTVKPRYVTPEERAPVTAAALKGIKAVEESASLPALAAKYAYEQLPVEQRAMLETAGRMAGNVGQRIAQSVPVQAAGEVLGRVYPNAGKLTNYIGGSPADNPMFNLETGPGGLEALMAFHGTPHKLIGDILNAKYIGAGEGAQIIGHGLYLAESPTVAGRYIRPGEREIGFRNWDTAPILADKAFAQGNGDVNAAIDILDKELALTKGDAKKNNLHFAKSILRRGDQSASLYKADIPDEWIPKMLDWDKPLSEQSEHVQKSLKAIGYEQKPIEFATHDSYAGEPVFKGVIPGGNMYPRFPSGGDIYIHHNPGYPWQVRLPEGMSMGGFDTAEEAMNAVHKEIQAANPTGEEIYKRISQNAAKQAVSQEEWKRNPMNALYNRHLSKVQASEQLKQLDIPGIKYLDAGSREAEEGTRNFVIFPGMEQDVKILERNGLPIERTFAEGGSVHYADGGLVDRIAKLSRQAQFKAADLAGLGPEVRFATTAPEQYFPKEEQHNQRGDAMRHILLQAQLMQKHGENPAKIISWLHENLALGQGEAEKAMDLYNDELGREIGRTAKSKEEMVNRALQAIESGEAHTLAEGEGGYAEGGPVNTDDDDYGQPFGDEIAKLYQGGLYRKGGEVHKYIVTSLTPVQKRLLKAHHAELGDESSFDDWMSDAGIPAIIHGHATKSMDSFLTPEQREMLDQVNS